MECSQCNKIIRPFQNMGAEDYYTQCYMCKTRLKNTCWRKQKHLFVCSKGPKSIIKYCICQEMKDLEREIQLQTLIVVAPSIPENEWTPPKFEESWDRLPNMH